MGAGVSTRAAPTSRIVFRKPATLFASSDLSARNLSLVMLNSSGGQPPRGNRLPFTHPACKPSSPQRLLTRAWAIRHGPSARSTGRRAYAAIFLFESRPMVRDSPGTHNKGLPEWPSPFLRERFHSSALVRTYVVLQVYIPRVHVHASSYKIQPSHFRGKNALQTWTQTRESRVRESRAHRTVRPYLCPNRCNMIRKMPS